MKPQCSSKNKKPEWVSVGMSALTYVLKNQATKFLLSKLANIALMSTTWQVWIAKFIVTELFDRVVIPLLKELEMEGKYRIDVINGRKRIKLLDRAIENEDEAAINNYIDTL